MVERILVRMRERSDVESNDVHWVFFLVDSELLANPHSEWLEQHETILFLWRVLAGYWHLLLVALSVQIVEEKGCLAWNLSFTRYHIGGISRRFTSSIGKTYSDIEFRLKEKHLIWSPTLKSSSVYRIASWYESCLPR